MADNATIIGDVVTGDNCSIWFQVVIRGDVNSISIGNKVNIQDGAIIHCSYKKAATMIGSNVSIGHNAIVHGCKIQDNVLIGMGAIVMDNCIIESNSIIGAWICCFRRNSCGFWIYLCWESCKKNKEIRH